METGTGECNGNFLGIGADDCNRAVLVEQSAAFGLLIANAEFTSFHGDDPTMVEVRDTNKGLFVSAIAHSGGLVTRSQKSEAPARLVSAIAHSWSGEKLERGPQFRHPLAAY